MPHPQSDTPPGSADGARREPSPMPKAMLCPYCGHVSPDTTRCVSCRGFFDPLSRQASQNAMGPWFLRDETQPFRPGCSYETLRALATRGRLTLDTVIRGPSTRQFWSPARRTPGVANLLGVCHNCAGTANAHESACASCGASFGVEPDRQFLGLGPVRLLPGQASPEMVAESTLRPPIIVTGTPEPPSGPARAASPTGTAPAPVAKGSPSRGGGGSRALLAPLLGVVAVAAIAMPAYVLFAALRGARGGTSSAEHDRLTMREPGPVPAGPVTPDPSPPGQAPSLPTEEMPADQDAQASAERASSESTPEAQHARDAAMAERIASLISSGDEADLTEAESLVEAIADPELAKLWEQVCALAREQLSFRLLP